MRRQWNWLIIAILIVGTRSAVAQVDSGPEPGKAAPALPVRVVQDGRAAEPKDLVKERGDAITAYIFLPSSRFDRPAARLVKGVEAAVQKVQVQHPTAGLVLVWMAEDADAAAKRIAQIQGSLQLSATWTVFTGPASGPEGWAINDKAAVTVVTAGQSKVTARFGYDSVNETVLPEVERALKLTADK